MAAERPHKPAERTNVCPNLTPDHRVSVPLMSRDLDEPRARLRVILNAVSSKYFDGQAAAKNFFARPSRIANEAQLNFGIRQGPYCTVNDKTYPRAAFILASRFVATVPYWLHIFQSNRRQII